MRTTLFTGLSRNGHFLFCRSLLQRSSPPLSSDNTCVEGRGPVCQTVAPGPVDSAPPVYSGRIRGLARRRQQQILTFGVCILTYKNITFSKILSSERLILTMIRLTDNITVFGLPKSLGLCLVAFLGKLPDDP
jgi:hypothetical protein